MICKFRYLRWAEPAKSMQSFLSKTRARLGRGGRTLVFVLLTVVLGAAQKDPLLVSARQALDKDDITEAIVLLEKYRQNHSTDAEAYNLLGIAYGRAGKNEQSLAMFKEFARLAPNSAGAYNNLGATYLRQQDLQHAEAAFRHALKISPQDVSALYNLGALLNAQRKYAESRPLLDRALRHEHSSAIAYEAALATAGVGDRKTALRILASMEPPQDQSVLP